MQCLCLRMQKLSVYRKNNQTDGGNKMKSESGRSLIEIIGVLAIGAAMTATTYIMYNNIHQNTMNTQAAAGLREIAKDIKMLFNNHSDYTGLSVEYLVKQGALKSEQPPIGEGWAINAGNDSTTFSIKLTGLSDAQCNFFAAAVPQWANEMYINGFDSTHSIHCFSGGQNEIVFIGK